MARALPGGPRAHRAAPMSVVTRFAPSPTGRLHVGNIRTGLHNWLWVHLPLSFALILLMFVHIYKTLQYRWPG